MLGAGVMTVTWNALPSPSARVYQTAIESAGTTTLRPMILMEEPTERDYVSALWSEDWDSPEDAAQDR